MKADPKTEDTLMNVVKQCFEAFTKKDLDTIMAFCAPDPDVVLIGTGGDERCVGLVEVRNILGRSFAQFEEASFEFGWHSVSAAGSVAMLAADVTLCVKTGGRQITQQIRLTAVLEQRETNGSLSSGMILCRLPGRKKVKRSGHSHSRDSRRLNHNHISTRFFANTYYVFLA